MDETDEILDVFDEGEQQIGTIRRGDIGTLQPGGGRYIRSVDAFIQRPNGDIWVPTRSQSKSIAPGGLDYSVGGHLGHGEDYMHCLIREFQEEAGIALSEETVRQIGASDPSENGSIYFNRLYLFVTDKEPHLSAEHTSGEWMKSNELINRLRSGAKAKQSLIRSAQTLTQYDKLLT
jgi:8-oxo-dGTP pyrophosphatase MutT (NUDIX family)